MGQTPWKSEKKNVLLLYKVQAFILEKLLCWAFKYNNFIPFFYYNFCLSLTSLIFTWIYFYLTCKWSMYLVQSCYLHLCFFLNSQCKLENIPILRDQLFGSFLLLVLSLTFFFVFLFVYVTLSFVFHLHIFSVPSRAKQCEREENNHSVRDQK